VNCFMCGVDVSAVYISRRGKRFCKDGCAEDWANMNPMPVKSKSYGRRGERTRDH
jgi:hypothetical protein